MGGVFSGEGRANEPEIRPIDKTISVEILSNPLRPGGQSVVTQRRFSVMDTDSLEEKIAVVKAFGAQVAILGKYVADAGEDLKGMRIHVIIGPRYASFDGNGMEKAFSRAVANAKHLALHITIDAPGRDAPRKPDLDIDDETGRMKVRFFYGDNDIMMHHFGFPMMSLAHQIGFRDVGCTSGQGNDFSRSIGGGWTSAANVPFFFPEGPDDNLHEVKTISGSPREPASYYIDTRTMRRTADIERAWIPVDNQHDNRLLAPRIYVSEFRDEIRNHWPTGTVFPTPPIWRPGFNRNAYFASLRDDSERTAYYNRHI